MRGGIVIGQLQEHIDAQIALGAARAFHSVALKRTESSWAGVEWIGCGGDRSLPQEVIWHAWRFIGRLEEQNGKHVSTLLMESPVLIDFANWAIILDREPWRTSLFGYCLALYAVERDDAVFPEEPVAGDALKAFFRESIAVPKHGGIPLFRVLPQS